MTAALIDHVEPWTDEEYLALGETANRIELFDGSLHVSPAPTPQHQVIASELYVAFRHGARKSGYRALEAVNVRLKPGRIVIPDLVIADVADLAESIIPATAVALVCEVISPGNAATDRVLKMHFYATAGIPWYLLVEQDSGHLHLHRLDGDKYVAHASAAPGETLALTEPVAAEIDPADLVR